MKSVHSTVVAFDGESKCGKTTIVQAVALEAEYQARIIPNTLHGEFSSTWPLNEDARQSLTALHQHLTFNSINTVSAGNMFRAAAYYVVSEERKGNRKTALNDSDVGTLRDLLCTDGIVDILQNDPDIGRRVSPVATMVGARALCETVFCDAVLYAYHAQGGSNLVVVDARDPIGIMQRHDILGSSDNKIDPASILPVYIDTPLEVAAQRRGGNLEEQIADVRSRRMTDATRQEFPITRPTNLIDEFNMWQLQFFDVARESEIATPYCLNNGEHVGLDSIQNFAGHIAVTAQEVGHTLWHRVVAD